MSRLGGVVVLVLGMAACGGAAPSPAPMTPTTAPARANPDAVDQAHWLTMTYRRVPPLFAAGQPAAAVEITCIDRTRCYAGPPTAADRALVPRPSSTNPEAWLDALRHQMAACGVRPQPASAEELERVGHGQVPLELSVVSWIDRGVPPIGCTQARAGQGCDPSPGSPPRWSIDLFVPSQPRYAVTGPPDGVVAAWFGTAATLIGTTQLVRGDWRLRFPRLADALEAAQPPTPEAARTLLGSWQDFVPRDPIDAALLAYDRVLIALPLGEVALRDALSAYATAGGAHTLTGLFPNAPFALVQVEWIARGEAVLAPACGHPLPARDAR